jgi:hypothetical protein
MERYEGGSIFTAFVKPYTGPISAARLRPKRPHLRAVLASGIHHSHVFMLMIERVHVHRTKCNVYSNLPP